MSVRSIDLGRVLGGLVASATSLACGTGSSGAADSGAACSDTFPDGGPVQVTGTVVAPNGDGGYGPVPGAMVAVEYGGLYRLWCNLSEGSPFYVFGAVTDDAGSFTLAARSGSLGFHAFATDTYYGRAPLDTSQSTTVQLSLVPQGAGLPKPTITGAALNPATVSSGGSVTLSATVTAASGDPLSDETIVVEPTHSWAAELNPPSAGTKDDFPNGTWSLTFAAPAQTGTYTYWLSATSAGCVSSDEAQLTLTVQ